MMERKVIKVLSKSVKRLIKELTTLNDCVSFKEPRLENDNNFEIDIHVKANHSIDRVETIISRVECNVHYLKELNIMRIIFDVTSLHDDKVFNLEYDIVLEDLYIRKKIFKWNIYFFNSCTVKRIIKLKRNILGSYINYSLYFVNKQVGIYPLAVGVHRNKRLRFRKDN